LVIYRGAGSEGGGGGECGESEPRDWFGEKRDTCSAMGSLSKEAQLPRQYIAIVFLHQVTSSKYLPNGILPAEHVLCANWNGRVSYNRLQSDREC
jgi:hypothetical protein